MTTYSVKEMFYTLQGEGANTGRAAVFCRFSGCNLWSGQEKDRENSVCTFCDTDFIGVDGDGGGKFKSAEALANEARSHWAGSQRAKPLIVCTGGEPLLQLDTALINALHAEGFEIAVETNGTIMAPEGIDWICVSPKAGSKIIQTSGQELKLVFPQSENTPEQFKDMKFEHFYLQPKDDDKQAENIQATINYCQKHPQWRLSLQTHKITGIR